MNLHLKKHIQDALSKAKYDLREAKGKALNARGDLDRATEKVDKFTAAVDFYTNLLENAKDPSDGGDQ